MKKTLSEKRLYPTVGAPRTGLIRILPMLLSLVLILGACGGTTASSTPSPSESATPAASSTEASASVEASSEAQADVLLAAEPTTISLLYRDEGSYPYNADWIIWSEITRRTNVTLEPIVVPGSDWDTKLQVLMSTADAPDFIPRIYPGGENNYVPSGSVVAISDVMDKLVNYQEKISKWGLADEVNNALNQADGKQYLLTGLSEVPQVEFGFGVRKDILDKHSLKVPADYMELEKMLMDLKAAYPDQYIWTDKWGSNLNGHVWSASWGTGFGGWSSGNAYYLEPEDKWTFTFAMPEYREYLKFMRRMVEEKIYDPETYVQSGDQLVEKLTTGKAFFSAANYNEIVEWNDFGSKNVGPDFKFEMIVPPTGPAGNIGRQMDHLGSGVMIPSTTKDKPYFDTVLKFVDWMYYSDEAMLLSRWGVEGTTFEMKDGKRQPLVDINYKWMNPGAPKDIRKDFGMDNLAFMGATSAEIRYEMMPPEEQIWQKAYLEKMPLKKVFPKLLMDVDTQEESALIGTALWDHATTSFILFVTGEKDPEKDWDAYLQELETKGMSKYVEMLNRVWQGQKKN